MTLSQRLTRAGLTFVLFGTVAAVLPQQNGAASANPNGCFTGTPGRYAISNIQPAASSTNVNDIYTVTTTPTTFNFYFSPDSTSAYSAVTPNISTIAVNSGSLIINSTIVTASSAVTNSSSTESIAKNGTNTGSSTFTSNFTSGANTYSASITVGG